jgi:thiol-disulfide isomerase/thioredoxin
VACNPYCAPCASAHKKLDELVEKYPTKIAVQVRLLCNPANEEDKRTIATKAILQQATILKNNYELKTMLTEWFEWMNYEKWSANWKTTTEIDVNKSMKAHTNWVDETGIAHTPTFFINGRGLPSRYELKDIDKMVPQLEDAFVGVLK